MAIVSIPQTQEKVINQFEEVVINNQPAKLKKIIISDDKRLKISDKNLDAIIKYYNENPSNLNSDILYLKNMYPGESNGDTTNPFAIITKKVMFKEKYYIKLNPRYIEVESPYKDVKIDLYCGEELISENIKNGDTVYGIFKSKTKEIKSNVVQISGSSEIYLSYEYTKPPTIEEVKTDVSELMYNYLCYFADAINYNNFSYIEQYISVDSDLYNLQKTNVPKFYEKGISEEYINHEIIDISYDEEQCKGSITVKEVYDITNTDKYNTVEKIFNNKYEFVFNEIDGTYKLTNLVED